MPAGRTFVDSLAPRAAPVTPCHLRGDATFVQENQLRRIDLAGFLPPDTALELARSRVLLGGVE